MTGERRLAWDWTGLDLGGPGLDLGWPGLDWTLGSLAWGGLDWTGLAWTLGGWTGLDWPGQKYCDCMPCMTVNTTTSRFVTVCLACDTGSYDLGEGQSLCSKGSKDYPNLLNEFFTKVFKFYLSFSDLKRHVNFKRWKHDGLFRGGVSHIVMCDTKL